MKQPTQKQLFRRLLRRLAPYWPAVAGMSVCMVAVGLLAPALPWMLSPLLDHGTQNKNYILPADWLPLIFFALIIVQSVFSYGRSYLAGWLDATLQRDFRSQMGAALLRLPQEGLRRETKGKITSRFMSYLPILTGSFTQVCLALLQEAVKILSLTATLFYLQWKLALLVFFIVPLVALTIRNLKRRMKRAADNAQSATAQGQNCLNETVQLLPVVKLQGGGRAAQWMNESFARLRGTSLRLNILLSAGQPISYILLGIPFALIVAYVVGALETGAMSPGAVASFVTAMVLLPPPVRNLTRAVSAWEQMFAAAREIFFFLDMPPEADNGKKTIARARGEITFSKVSFAYAPGRDVLQNISLQIAPGETIALVGRSGAGKTTLAGMLPRFHLPQSGKILLDGADINELTLASLRKQFALVTQQPLLFNDTVAFNVAYPDNPDDTKLKAALQNAAADFVFDLPQGVNTPVGEDGGALSAGQRQRIALARAFYRDAPIVILDEPTASLDAETESAIKTAFRKLFAGRAAIVIAHHLTAIDFVDRILVLESGKITAEGTVDELQKTSPLFAELCRQYLKR